MAFNVVLDLPVKTFNVKYLFHSDSFVVEFAEGGSLVITITDTLGIAPNIDYKVTNGWLNTKSKLDIEVDGELYNTEGEISFCKMVYAIARKHGLEL